MIQFSTALRRVLAHPLTLEDEACPLAKAVGRVLASDFCAPGSLPRWDYSAMDGYAVASRSVRSATAKTPATLRIVGESRPGRPHRKQPPRTGEAIVISTGGLIPPGCDAVAPVEWTAAPAPGHVAISRILRPGDHVRIAGSDVKQDALLLQKGRLLDAAGISVIAQFGLESVRVLRRPRVGLLTSGDELIPVGRPATGDHVVATNVFYARRLLEDCNCQVRDFGIAADRPGALARRLTHALDWSDFVVTMAGVSAGERDFVVPALESVNARILFHGVAIKPGKPCLFAMAKGKPVFGLPGNPLSAACGLHIFIKPYLLNSYGSRLAHPRRMEAPLAGPAGRDRRRLTFLFARLSWTTKGPVVHPPSRQESGNLSLLADADCLAEIPPGESKVPRGTRVRIWPLR